MLSKRIYSYSSLFPIVWIVIVGYTLYFLRYQIGDNHVTQIIFGWIHSLTIVSVCISLGIHLTRNQLIFLIVSLLLVVVACLYAEAKNLFIVGHLMTFLLMISPTFSPTFALNLSILLTPIFIFLVINSRFEGVHIITSGKMIHKIPGGNTRITVMAGKVLRMKFDNISNFFTFFGGGDISVISAGSKEKDERVLFRIPRVPFLWWRKKSILDSLYGLSSIEDDQYNDSKSTILKENLDEIEHEEDDEDGD